jgi:hypothetical protein
MSWRYTLRRAALAAFANGFTAFIRRSVPKSITALMSAASSPRSSRNRLGRFLTAFKIS